MLSNECFSLFLGGQQLNGSGLWHLRRGWVDLWAIVSRNDKSQAQHCYRSPRRVTGVSPTEANSEEPSSPFAGCSALSCWMRVPGVFRRPPTHMCALASSESALTGDTSVCGAREAARASGAICFTCSGSTRPCCWWPLHVGPVLHPSRLCISIP